MFRLAANSDLPGIIALWQEAFGDTPEAVSHFFESFPNCRSYVAEEAGEIISMVHALPQTLSPDIPAAYIYAVATLQRDRGKGLCRKLMAFAEADLQHRGFACCVLTPGEESLFAFYTNLGYETVFTRKHTAFDRGREISLPDYLTRREELLTVPHMIYDENTLAYAARVYGLHFYQTETGIAAASKSYTAEVLPEDQSGQPFAMLKWLGKPQPMETAYLGFALE